MDRSSLGRLGLCWWQPRLCMYSRRSKNRVGHWTCLLQAGFQAAQRLRCWRNNADLRALATTAQFHRRNCMRSRNCTAILKLIRRLTALGCTALILFASLAAPGFGLDSSTGTCSSKHAELLYPNAWVLFPSWLAAMVARTIICI